MPYDAAAGEHCTGRPDRFEAPRSTADIKWRTGDLMDMPHEESWDSKSPPPVEQVKGRGGADFASAAATGRRTGVSGRVV